jgi:hypothetical protein
VVGSMVKEEPSLLVARSVKLLFFDRFAPPEGNDGGPMVECRFVLRRKPGRV